MPFRMLALALVLVACSPKAPAPQSAEPPAAPPSVEGLPARDFAPDNDGAAAATGALRLALTQRLPEAPAGAPREVVVLNGAGGYALEAELVGVAPPSIEVEGQTVRALMRLPVDVGHVLLYRVAREDKGAQAGLCGAGVASHALIWDSEGEGGTAALRVMGLTGAPGAEDVRFCPPLSYAGA